MKRFAVLQLSGCAGCDVSLVNADAWVNEYKLVYMPLVVSTYDIPEVDILLITGGVRTDEDLYKLRHAVKRAERVVAVGTCAISGGVANLGDRDEVREIFLAHHQPHLAPRLLPKCHPVDSYVTPDLYLSGCPPTPELFMAVLLEDQNFQASKIVCQECGRTKLRDMRPTHLMGFQQGEVDPEICLINQGYLCIGTSTRGGCRAPCPRAGHPCVGCRGPSDVFIEKDSEVWLNSIRRVFDSMTAIPTDEIEAGLRSPQLALFLFQFSDYAGGARAVRPKEKML
jgi:F420-non-reducing hydrogenase small subunit